MPTINAAFRKAQPQCYAFFIARLNFSSLVLPASFLDSAEIAATTQGSLLFTATKSPMQTSGPTVIPLSQRRERLEMAAQNHQS